MIAPVAMIAACWNEPRDMDVDAVMLLKAAVLGLVEGLTEFLPISSTGHLILAASLLDFTGETAKVFEIAIQSGAMLAVIWEYRQRLWGTVQGLGSDPVAQRFARNVLIAFIPAVIFGLALGKVIKGALFHPVPVAVAFIVGGLIILWVERRQGGADSRGAEAETGDAAAPEATQPARFPRVHSVAELSALDALKIGLIQCLALVPGTSRSGATIIGGMVLGFSRSCATEFSFYLGIPTLMGAGAYSVWKSRDALSAADLPLFAVGTVVAFASALLCIRWLIRYVAGHSFVPFAWYRIGFGAVVLITAWGGWVQWSA